MADFPPLLRRSSPRLLLLGLVALLLWGQCALHLNESGRSRKPAPNLHLQTAVRVVRIDSIPALPHEACYLTFALQNQSDRPCRLSTLSCELWFEKQKLGQSVIRATSGTLLPAHGEQVLTAVITPYASINSKAGTNLGQLRTAWQRGQLPQHRARLEVLYGYYLAEGDVADANYRTSRAPLGK